MKFVRQELNDVLYVANEWIQADRRRVAEAVREAICNVIDAAGDVSIMVTVDELLDQIRALDISKLLAKMEEK